MDRGPSRTSWAVGLAALVGGVGGSFLAGLSGMFGTTVPTNHPLLGGSAAIYTGFALGAVLAPAVAAAIAYLVARLLPASAAATAGAVAGIVTGSVVSIYAEQAARWWVSEFGANPFVGAVAGALVAGVAAGGAIVAAVQAGARGTRGIPLRFAGLIGAVAGLMAGVGGAGVGFTLAESESVCPNGYSGLPAPPPPNCWSGVGQGSLVLGIWFGAAAGVLGAVAVTLLFRLLSPRTADPSVS